MPGRVCEHESFSRSQKELFSYFVYMVYVRTFQISFSRHTVRVKKTCPNLREEYSSCGPYKFTCKHCVRPRTLIERFLHIPLCTKNEEQPKLGARYSNSRGMGLLKRWVDVRVACLPLPVQP